MDATKKYVKRIFDIKSKQHNYLYHNWQHSVEVMNEAVRIAKNSGLKEEKIEDIAIAALFHDVGYEKGSTEHETRGAEMAEEYLKSRNFPKSRIQKIKKLILATKVNNPPQSLEEMIIKDADLSHLGKPHFFRNYYNLQKELNTVFKLNIDDEEWRSATIAFIKNQKFYTQFAKENYLPLKEENLKQLKQMKDEGYQKMKA